MSQLLQLVHLGLGTASGSELQQHAGDDLLENSRVAPSLSDKSAEVVKVRMRAFFWRTDLLLFSNHMVQRATPKQATTRDSTQQ